MKDLFYPLTFEPLYKDYLWGGKNLKKLGKPFPDTIVAESWEISSHHDGMGIVANGHFKGRTLEDLSNEYGEKFLGVLSSSRYRSKFPLLLKLIDANQWLSVQVHPDDEYSEKHEKDLGKSEMWYILDAEPGATILYGLTSRMTKEEFKKTVEEGRITEVLKSVPVSKGDVVYIPSGTIHAAGKGILIVEVQENSNATYRLYDYDRTNPDGSKRPLHIAKALDCIDFTRATHDGKFNGLVYEKDGAGIRVVIADPHFCVEVVDVKSSATFTADDRTFIAYTFLEGEGRLIWSGGKMDVKAATSVLIPANLGEYKLEGDIKALKAYIGDINRDVIAPLLSAGYSREDMAKAIGGLA